ncbi:HNH endonuclease [Leptobacterium flavescens]|uniref:HNH endonuclease n=1 Tax=Leptobacterium flavescens TaxID=472055 RepID=A0A6P0UUP8_9FLAO|nr:HNH endonuclease signature motif containing protein [Leptobacterium flavescens]NER14543.1 HNH endonuclease [Leptobacterium flavescens]
MMRQTNTDSNGGSWTESQIRLVWEDGKIVPGKSPNEFRKDKCESIIKWSEHGNRNSQYGWEIDHINPVSNGGGDEFDNLQPLQWENNAKKGDQLNWIC